MERGCVSFAVPGAPVFRPASPAQRAKLPYSIPRMPLRATGMARRHFASGAPVFTPASPRAAGRNSRRYSPHGTARNGDGATPPTRPPWRFAVPGQARWISEHGGGSFAAQERRSSDRHRPRSGRNSPTPSPACRCAQRGCRDAGLKTGAPNRLVRRVRSDRGPDRLHRHFRAVTEESASPRLGLAKGSMSTPLMEKRPA